MPDPDGLILLALAAIVAGLYWRFVKDNPGFFGGKPPREDEDLE